MNLLWGVLVIMAVSSSLWSVQATDRHPQVHVEAPTAGLLSQSDSYQLKLTFKVYLRLQEHQNRAEKLCSFEPVNNPACFSHSQLWESVGSSVYTIQSHASSDPRTAKADSSVADLKNVS